MKKIGKRETKQRSHFNSRLRQKSFARFLLALLLAASAIQAACAHSSPDGTSALAAASAAPTHSYPSGALSPMGNIIPRPVSAIPAEGSFVISTDTTIRVDPGADEVQAIGQYLARALNPSTGFSLKVLAASGAPARGSISLTLEGAPGSLGDEGYQLSITPDRVRIAARQPAGLFHGVQTLRQLLPPAIESSSFQPGPWSLPAGTITDTPRFAWRGVMLDVSRHFFTVEDVTRYIDLLAYYKINHLHIHLSDDQGWRIQIKSWPNLTLTGSSLEVGGSPGGYYSQADYSYIVKYARSRYISILPELDMPGHINAALASYPELNCNERAPELYTGTEVGFSSICVGKDSSTQFLKDVIGELAALTPGAYIHIGGDEANATALPAYLQFIQQVQSILAANGKQMVGWDPIAQIRLLPGSIVQETEFDAALARRAVQQGNKLIMSPANRAYLDMKYNPTTSLGLNWAGTIDVQKAYSWDPGGLFPGITDQNILGVEAPLWSETLVTMNDVEYMAFPRLLGYAEIGWSPQSARVWFEYRLRLASHGPRLTALGIHFYASPEIPWP
jgi:hexosaminidase